MTKWLPMRLISRIGCLIILGFLIAPNAWSQGESINDLIRKLQNTLTKVESANAAFEPQVELIEGATVRYTYTQTDKKGEKTTVSSDLNLADIDPYAVRQETSRDIIYVVLTAKNKQKLFSSTKNGKSEPYDHELKILSKDVDQARDIADIIKKTIPLAEKQMEGRLKLSGYEAMKKWLIDHVVNVNDGGKSINQTLTAEAYPGSFKLVQVESDGKSSHQTEYVFNVGDINATLLGLKVSGTRVGVDIPMADRLKSVSVMRDGQPKPFEDNVIISAASIDAARDLRTTLGLMVPQAQAKIKESLPTTNSADDALSKIAALLGEVRAGDDTFKQMLSGKCLTTVTMVQSSSGSSTTTTSTFNWMDIIPALIRLETSGAKMTLELPMLEKRKLVNVSKNGKVTGYQAETSLMVPQVEAGRRIQHLAVRLIEVCKTSYKNPFPADLKGVVTWMCGAVGEVQVEEITVKQTLERAGDDQNKMKFSRTTIKASSATEEIFEFNLGDISLASITSDVNGKMLTVKIETNFKNKIIKAYKGGKIQPYASGIEIPVADADAARNLVGALRFAVENLGKR